MKKYSIGFINHFDKDFTHLENSLKQLSGEYDLLTIDSKNPPAINYNKLIDKCQTPYLILTHQDVCFPPNLLDCLDKTISIVPNFGALGLVGVNSEGRYCWSSSKEIFPVDTLDCCFIVIRKDLGVRFDEETFDEFHMYVEDYCGQLSRLQGLKIYTILSDSGRDKNFDHIGYTLLKKGTCWGKWHEYRKRLDMKWPGIRTT